MNKKSFLSLLLALSLPAACLIACQKPDANSPSDSSQSTGTSGIDTEEKQETKAGTDTDRADYPDDIPEDLDFDGTEISVAVMSDAVYIIDWVCDKDFCVKQSVRKTTALLHTT